MTAILKMVFNLFYKQEVLYILFKGWSAVKVFVQSPLLATMSHKYCIY